LAGLPAEPANDKAPVPGDAKAGSNADAGKKSESQKRPPPPPRKVEAGE
jgi:hypothetical protein